jgi:peptidoglycan/xylan/chitin deacetylase (PgdA/CDA1 family)
VHAATLQGLLRVGLPIFCGGPRGREIALTFDDGPGEYTHDALRKLAGAHDRATFFDVGKSIELFPGYLRREERIAALGDHTYSHIGLIGLPVAVLTSELSRTAALIRAQSGQLVQLFRPPYELYDATVLSTARQLGLLTILWSIDSRDSLGADYAEIIATVLHNVRPGAIIELHENHGQTIRALATLLPALRKRHWTTVTIPQLLNTDPPSVAQVRRGLAGCGPISQTERGGHE